MICRDGLIEHIGPEPTELPSGVERVSVGGGYLAPGFVDIHVHGGHGHDFMDGTELAVDSASRAHLQHGVTSLFPTCTTGTHSQIMQMLDATKSVMEQSNTPGTGIERPRIHGVHLYGPYFAEEKAGCHAKSGCRFPTEEESSEYFSTGIVRIATCAAELIGAADFYRRAARHGCLITCGHSNSSWGEMESAFQLGMRHVDHFWCAMSSVVSLRPRFGFPMQASMAEYVLANPEMSTEVIADGCHLSPELLRFAWQIKGSKRLCLVSDCNRALDMPVGRYAFGNEKDENWIYSDGKVGRTESGGLASSVMALDTMIRNMASTTDIPLQEIIRMASLTPAERTGISDKVGSIAVGKKADLVILSNRLEVEHVYVSGRLVGKAC
ncbi:MAG: N-acetylglucosamine-6-phosphate deacetylase [Pirellula sp.]|nr:N-acetylglucosamine-6-phosphate deacetylase [Pirellula sp.]